MTLRRCESDVAEERPQAGAHNKATSPFVSGSGSFSRGSGVTGKGDSADPHPHQSWRATALEHVWMACPNPSLSLNTAIQSQFCLTEAYESPSIDEVELSLPHLGDYCTRQ
jgi:hypothetical protein